MRLAGRAGRAAYLLTEALRLCGRRGNVPAPQVRRPDWESAGQKATPILPKRGIELVTALGFDAEPAGSERLLVLRTSSGPRRAVAVLLRDDEHFDQKSMTYQLMPVAKALEIAGREDVPWVIALRKSTLRLYPGRDGVGVGQRGQSETYFELDLDLLAPEQAALLTLIFSADALDAGGSAQQILDGSGKYAADLGTRLRDRVYEGVVPRVALAIPDQLPALGLALDAQGLQMAYRLTMRVLFRLLFQAYGEATELLPAGRNDHYDANSLQAFITREIGTGPDQFSTESATMLSRMSRSPYAKDFILKGGMLLASFCTRRPTVDADALARNMASDQETVARRVAEIAAIKDPDDGVDFLPDTVTTAVMRDDALYSGVRVTMTARLATAQVKLRLDINFGDPVTPAPQTVELPSLRPDAPPIRILGYPRDGTRRETRHRDRTGTSEYARA